MNEGLGELRCRRHFLALDPVSGFCYAPGIGSVRKDAQATTPAWCSARTFYVGPGVWGTPQQAGKDIPFHCLQKQCRTRQLWLIVWILGNLRKDRKRK